VATAEFRRHAEKASGKPVGPLFDAWLNGKESPKATAGGGWSIFAFEEEPERALIVYGTLKEKHAQQEAAGFLQRKIARRWYNYEVPIKSDQEVTEDDLKERHLLLIGRPDSNAVVEQMAKRVPVSFGRASFVLRGERYANPASAVVAAGEHPTNPRYQVVLYAGLSAEATWHCVQRLPEADWPNPAVVCEVLLMAAGEAPKPLVVGVAAKQTASKEGAK
jgi:hypothetical protein